MTKQFIEKNIKLSLEFDNYLARHPEALRKIPNDAYIVITQKTDREFSDNSIAIVKSHHQGKPIVEAQKYRSNWTLKRLRFTAA